MQHCGGGAGVTGFADTVPAGDRFHDADAALEAWVEQGQAPSQIIATKYDSSGGVIRTHPLCGRGSETQCRGEYESVFTEPCTKVSGLAICSPGSGRIISDKQFRLEYSVWWLDAEETFRPTVRHSI